MRRPLLKLSVAAAVPGICAFAVRTAARVRAGRPCFDPMERCGAGTCAGAVHRFAHVTDLTRPLSEDTPYIPVSGITFPLKKTTIATISKNGVAANRWEIHEHLGTQIDAPNHFFDEGLSLERLPVAAWWCRSS
jgi:Putative cyclase